MQRPHLPRIAGSFFLLCLTVPVCAQTSTAASAPAAKAAVEPAMQVPPDQQAYRAAVAILDDRQRVAALEAFLRDFPQSTRTNRARHLLLETLLENNVQDVKQIHDLAQSIVDHADKGQRSSEENDVAYRLAEAPPNGIDLKSAEFWAKDAVDQSTLEATTATMKEIYEKDKLPMPSLERVQKSFARKRASNLQTLADVYFHEGLLVEASAALDEAQSLNPEDGSVYLTRSQIAHAAQHDAEAVDDLELAEIYGGMTPLGMDLLAKLYGDRHNGDSSGLDEEIDKRYVALQKPFIPTAHTAPASRRTALIELFTGSACAPCVAADLALDGVLQAYPRSEVVALSFDEHIPGPDPLANADTAARFKYHSGFGTPSVFVDGAEIDKLGGTREQGEKSFQGLSKATDADLREPSGLTVKLTARLTAANTIVTSANVEVDDPQALKTLLAAKSKSDAKSRAVKQTEAAEPTPASVGASKLRMNFALVQKQVRYSGENGIRFHSMVVRSIAKPSPDGFPVALAGPSQASFTFDPAAVSAALSKYLEAFSKHDDRFGATHFIMTDTSLPMDQLAVAAWVEDTVSHKVVAATFVPIDSTQLKAAR